MLIYYHTFNNFESFILNIKKYSLVIAEEMKKDRDSINNKIDFSELFKNKKDQDKIKKILSQGIIL